MEKLRLGYLPTRRFVFSREDAQRYKKEIQKIISEYDIDIIDIDDLNEEGLIYDSIDLSNRVIEKFTQNKVDAIFVPHCNFGTEDAVARVTKALGKPVLLWGPRDEAPLPDGKRLRDTQCGIFATGKVLRRYGVKFTYLQNCRLDDQHFDIGFGNFLRTANIIKAFKKTRILQIGPRPTAFMSMIINEGELLEKFGIEVVPINLKDIELKMQEYKRSSEKINMELEQLKNNLDTKTMDEKSAINVIALKMAIRDFATLFQCNCVTIQCWSTLQKCIGIMPCLSNAILTDEGLPVMCESDIHGAIGSVMAQAASMGKAIPFLADITVRHPENNNGELLFHCGNFPPSLAKQDTKMKFGNHAEFDTHLPGTCEGEIKQGNLSIIRFDGDNGEYTMFMGKAKTIEGPSTWGSYVWIEVNDWPLWEETLVTGPYVHHCVCIYDDIIAPMYEASKYIGDIGVDLVDPTEEELRRIIRGSEKGLS
jgi:L-fucose isomerase-like protein